MRNTLFIGKVYHRLDEIPSTNDYAQEMVAKSRPAEGTVVRADSQSAGRGQFGSRWQAEPGCNLTLSVILYPTHLAVGRQFYLSMAAALAVHDTLLACGFADAKIKWPNDLLIDGRKTAGILIQNSLKGARIGSSVVGIGLNVNQSVFPPELTQATSMALVAQKPFDLQNVENTLLGSFEHRYLQLKSEKYAELNADYHERLYARGEWREFRRPDALPFRARVEGVEPESGRLCLLSEGGETAWYDLKEVGWVLG